jgi:hypothetical protein
MVGDIRYLSFEIGIGYCTEEPRLNVYCCRRKARTIQNVLDDPVRDRLGLEFSDTPSFLDNLNQFTHHSPPETRVQKGCLQDPALLA